MSKFKVGDRVHLGAIWHGRVIEVLNDSVLNRPGSLDVRVQWDDFPSPGIYESSVLELYLNGVQLMIECL
jgi:hypothetical protein